MMTYDRRALHPIEKSREAHYGIALNPVSAHGAAFDALRCVQPRTVSVRAAVLVGGGSIGLNYLRIRQQRLDGAKSFN